MSVNFDVNLLQCYRWIQRNEMLFKWWGIICNANSAVIPTPEEKEELEFGANKLVAAGFILRSIECAGFSLRHALNEKS